MNAPQKPQIEKYRPHEGRLLDSADVGTVGSALHLVGSHCKHCDARTFPGNAICPFCLSDDVEMVPLSSAGNLYSFTFVHIAPPAWEVPYGVGYVDLPEGVRLFGKLANADSAQWKLDQQVRVEVTTVPGVDGQAPQYQYFFNAA
ncbi:MAG TPA: OB-fold domain-containing protein [Herbaspirillum sp.]|jgi:uncharacterized OB-fold protein